MTTGDAVGDVTHMIAPLKVATLVKKREDEVGEETASELALAESVTKTVSTWSALLSF
jgi:hypothetical protein